MDIAVIGDGSVAVIVAACLADMGGHNVVLVDCDEQERALLERGESLFYEEGLCELLAARRHRLQIGSGIGSAVARAQVVFLAPRTDAARNPKLPRLSELARMVAGSLNGYKVIAVTSSVPVGTCRRLKLLMQHKTRCEFDVVCSPEFLRKGSGVHDFQYPERVILGSESERATETMTNLYRTFRLPRIVRLETAELVKQAANAFLALKISYGNLLAQLCEHTGADVAELLAAVGDDKRIGRAFLQPGIGFGGPCMPDDLERLSHTLVACGESAALLREVRAINEAQRGRLVEKISEILGGLAGKLIAVLGAAFKSGTDDVQNSPALATIRALIERGAVLRIYDPAVAALPLPQVQWTQSALDCCAHADAVLLLTPWPEFGRLDLDAIRAALASPVLIDGRNFFDPEWVRKHALEYHCMGRPASASTFPAPEKVTPAASKSGPEPRRANAARLCS